MLEVKFLMHDGDTEVACRADIELRRHRFGSFDRDSDLVAFKNHREEIEAAAGRKFDEGIFEPHLDAKLIVHEEDLESGLSRKLRAIVGAY